MPTNILDLRPRLIQQTTLGMNLQPIAGGYMAWLDIAGKEIRRKGRDREHAISRVMDALNQHFKTEGIDLVATGYKKPERTTCY